MGYAPRLIVCHNDLKQKEAHIQEMHLGYAKKEVEARLKEPYKVLYEALNRSPVPFRRENLIMIQPDLTDLNKRVRALLTRLDIYFAVDA